jgi:hypothetical protein
MIGFIGTSVTLSLNYNQWSAIADLHFIIHCYTHTSRLLLTDLNTEAITSNRYEFFLSVRPQSLWNHGTQMKIFQQQVYSDYIVAARATPKTRFYCTPHRKQIT